MPRTVSASEAKTKFGSIVDWATQAKDEVIVETHGRPKVVIIPFEEYEKMVKLREASRRRDALAKLEHLRQRIRARNQDLTEGQAKNLASRLSKEVLEKMAEQGKVTFRDQ